MTAPQNTPDQQLRDIIQTNNLRVQREDPQTPGLFVITGNRDALIEIRSLCYTTPSLTETANNFTNVLGGTAPPSLTVGTVDSRLLALKGQETALAESIQETLRNLAG